LEAKVHHWAAILATVIGFVSLPSSVSAQMVQELRVLWESATPAGPPVAPGTRVPLFTPLELKHTPGLLPRPRSLELSTDQIVVVGLDAQGKEVYRNVMLDPRILRAEGPGPTGELTGQVLYHARTEFLIAFPDDQEIAELRLYHPRWTGAAFALDLLASFDLR
jgi:hypothetical protein